ncbi:MAG: stage VI sporulation protein F [Bacilli bacterium]|nr:stage VI sporulation protein F [Bacilli bacterium]
MNFNKALQFITDNNIQPEAVFELVEKVKNMDLSNEENIRNVIKDVSKLAGKPIDKAQEDNIVREIMKNGVNDNLFNML